MFIFIIKPNQVWNHTKLLLSHLCCTNAENFALNLFIFVLRRFEMYLCDCLTSWQYCSTPSLVPTQLLVPDGSGSQRPVWMLTCMLSFPQNIATCGSATANPVPALAASACRKTDREKCQLMQSVIKQPIKAGECTCWQIWDTVCSTCFSHKYHYEIQHRNLVIWSLNT